MQQLARDALGRQRPDRSMPPGWNGPNKVPDTPARTSAHWLKVFSWLYRHDPRQCYLDCVHSLADYLISPNVRPHGSSFYCLRSPRHDRSNGLIGQAWVIEGLHDAAEILGDGKYRGIAKEVFDLHPFDDSKALWLRRDIDGTLLGHDPTFNHQLWFAAAAAELLGPAAAKPGHPIANFMDGLERNFQVQESGRVCHTIDRCLTRVASVDSAKWFVRRQLRRGGSALGIRKLVDRFSRELGTAREPGYHAFNMYAFAMLTPHFAWHRVFQSQPFLRAVTYMESQTYERELADNPYGYGYNPPGFELPLALWVFSDWPRERLLGACKDWINRQIKLTYDPATPSFSSNTEDPVTLNARIYECTRFPDEIVLAELDGSQTA